MNKIIASVDSAGKCIGNFEIDHCPRIGEQIAVYDESFNAEYYHVTGVCWCIYAMAEVEQWVTLHVSGPI